MTESIEQIKERWMRECEDHPIKRIIAGKVYEYLGRNLNESDISDWSAARRLKDIYECHSCVRQIAQVYSKGIIDGRDEDVFGGADEINPTQLTTIIGKMLNPDLRTPLASLSCSDVKPRIIDRNELNDMMQSAHGILVVDVRERDAFETNRLIDDAINIPLSEMWLNPFTIRKYADNMSTVVVLICEFGYKSMLAAGVLERTNLEICVLRG